MSNETKKSESPTCACGKVDLYEEMLKNPDNKEEDSDSTHTCDVGSHKGSDDSNKKD